MSQRVKYEANLHGMRELLNSEWCYNQLRKAAQRTVNYAKSTAPVGKPPKDKHPGLYRDSIRIEWSTSFRGTRARVDVVAPVPYAQKVERKYHTLSRALDGAKETH